PREICGLGGDLEKAFWSARGRSRRVDRILGNRKGQRSRSRFNETGGGRAQDFLPVSEDAPDDRSRSGRTALLAAPYPFLAGNLEPGPGGSPFGNRSSRPAVPLARPRDPGIVL